MPKPDKPEPLWITPADAAALMGVSKRTLFRLLAAKAMPQPLRYSRKLVRFNRAALMAWIAAQTATPA